MSENNSLLDEPAIPYRDGAVPFGAPHAAPPRGEDWDLVEGVWN